MYNCYTCSEVHLWYIIAPSGNITNKFLISGVSTWHTYTPLSHGLYTLRPTIKNGVLILWLVTPDMLTINMGILSTPLSFFSQKYNLLSLEWIEEHVFFLGFYMTVKNIQVLVLWMLIFTHGNLNTIWLPKEAAIYLSIIMWCQTIDRKGSDMWLRQYCTHYTKHANCVYYVYIATQILEIK